MKGGSQKSYLKTSAFMVKVGSILICWKFKNWNRCERAQQKEESTKQSCGCIQFELPRKLLRLVIINLYDTNLTGLSFFAHRTRKLSTNKAKTDMDLIQGCGFAKQIHYKDKRQESIKYLRFIYSVACIWSLFSILLSSIPLYVYAIFGLSIDQSTGIWIVSTFGLSQIMSR